MHAVEYCREIIKNPPSSRWWKNGAFILIDKKSYKLLKHLYKEDKLDEEEVNKITEHTSEKISNSYASLLLQNHLIEKRTVGDYIDEKNEIKDGKCYYKITLSGRYFIEEKRKNLFMFWFPYIITTALAIATLIVAIAGLYQK